MTTTIEFPVKLTPRAVRILESAAGEAEFAGAEGYIGVEHIFLAILREGDSVPAQVVRQMGLTNAIVDEIDRVLGADRMRPRRS